MEFDQVVDGKKIHLVANVHRATLGEELRRARSFQDGEKRFAEDYASQGVFAIYASVISATPSGEYSTDGEVLERWPPTWEEFLDIPRAAVDIWMETVWENNPDWAPEGANQKKASGTTPQTES